MEDIVKEFNPEKDKPHVDHHQIVICQIDGDLLEYTKHFFYVDDDLSKAFKYVNIAYSKTDDFKIIRSVVPLDAIYVSKAETFEDFHGLMIKHSSDYMIVTPQYETLKSVSGLPFVIFNIMTDV